MIPRESCAPVLMHRRAKSSRSTSEWTSRLAANRNVRTTSSVIKMHVCTPMQMFLTDPIVLLISVYMAFSDGVLYWLLETGSISFHERRHWPLKLSGLPFLAIILGVCIACASSLVFTRIRFRGIVRKYGRLCPEERLLPMVAGSIALPVGIFLFSWTASPDISPIPGIVAGVFLGFGEYP